MHRSLRRRDRNARRLCSHARHAQIARRADDLRQSGSDRRTRWPHHLLRRRGRGGLRGAGRHRQLRGQAFSADLRIGAWSLPALCEARRSTKERVLAIGDGIATDIAGAANFGVRSVFIASGVHVRLGESMADAAARLFGATPAGRRQPIAVIVIGRTLRSGTIA